MGDTQNTANTTNHHTMKRAIVIAASLALVWGAPQFKTDTINTIKTRPTNCRSEVTTVFEETETETVNKVICQTEFREDCSAKVSEVCRNFTTGEAKCEQIDNFVCVDSIANKCGIEKVLKNVSYTETVCRSKLENICEKEFIDGEAKPVEGSCVSKPTEECEQMVEKIPKKVSKKITKVVCDENEEGEEPTEEEDESSNNDDGKPEFVPVITTTEFMVDDGLLSESTTKTTTTSTMAPTTTTTTSTTTSTVTTEVRRMDGSK